MSIAALALRPNLDRAGVVSVTLQQSPATASTRIDLLFKSLVA